MLRFDKITKRSKVETFLRHSVFPFHYLSHIPYDLATTEFNILCRGLICCDTISSQPVEGRRTTYNFALAKNCGDTILCCNHS